MPGPDQQHNGARRPHAATWAAMSAALLLSACSTFKTAPAPTPASAPARPAPAPQPVVTARMLQAQDTVSRMVALQERLYRVAAPLLINNADLCRNHARDLLGFTAQNKYSYPGEYVEAAHAALGYGEQLQVSTVLPGSGAARAGLRKGDGLVAVEGKPLPTGDNADTQLGRVFGPLIGHKAALNITVRRGSASQVVPVPTTRACAFKIDLGNADNVNSYADGARVLITRGMIDFGQSDEAIAYVLARGIAHNVLGHPVTLRSAYTIGQMIDNLGKVEPDTSLLIGSYGIRAMPPDMDAAADYLALYLLARAGYDIGHVHAFWQRLATQYPATVLNGYTANHPGTVYRLGVIDKTVAEIKAKQAAKKPLLP